MPPTDPPPPYLFISHSASDADYANQLEAALTGLGMASWNFNNQVAAGEAYLEKAKPALERCTHILVLVGPVTKESQWVDMEMEIAMCPSPKGPGAHLIGVILPHHADFNRPYYEPELVPMRLHDFVRQDAALIRKWPQQPDEIKAWLEDVGNLRVSSRRPRPSLSTLRFIRENAWSNEGDQAREGLTSLSAQHPRPE